MGGKKKAGKKAGKKGDDDGEINQDDLHDILKAQVETLKSRIVLEQDRRDKANSNKDDMREDEKTRDDEQEEHKKHTRTVVHQMTKIYRTMETKSNDLITEK